LLIEDYHLIIDPEFSGQPTDDKLLLLALLGYDQQGYR
jgi:hypothetical protein